MSHGDSNAIKTGDFEHVAGTCIENGDFEMSESMTQLLARLEALVERAESAEAELLAVREDNHSMMLEIDGLRTERDRLAAELANLLAYPNVLRLTGEMIAELCGFAGFSFDREELDESLAEDEFTIHHCPTIGVREDDGSIGHYQYVVIAENGDDGEVFPLGPKLPAPVAAPAVPTDEQIHAAYRVALGQSIRERDMPEIRKFAIALLQSAGGAK